MRERRIFGRAWRGLLIGAAFGIASLPNFARAEDPPAPDSAAEARRQYEMGTQAFSQKLYLEAAGHFEGAAAVKANAVALYTAGLAWDLAGRPERAADDYARALDVPGLDAKQTATVTDRLTALERTLGTLVVTAPEGWKVGLDSSTYVAAPARLHGAPGPHDLRILPPNRVTEHREVALEAGAEKPVELKDEPKVPVPVEPEKEVAPTVVLPPPPPPDAFWTTSRAVGVGVVGAGLAALGAGIVLGVSANGAKDSYDAMPSRQGLDHASALQTWTNVAFVSSALLVVGGVVLVAVPLGKSDRRVDVRAALGGLVLGGSF